ncbi:glycerol-3-phosphate 1-O-acyltransferase PlsY [Mycoplasmopsis sturni]|uniref:glycerol-3-phosphate 1-O-acyltransferase PlsY n=1 Tax=Mycoplasmopsis sturni TaxID=39047 RepID=UPI00055B271E|nr:glycerol-3-phosphate 1-O-acyltransferase PlsY [Mycoplasmopsis sturni]
MEIFYAIIANLSAFLLGYLWGSLNTSIIFSKILKNDDVRNYHSKNAGATNSLRVYGKKFALAVLIIDILKVVLATYTAYFISWAWNDHIVFIPLLVGLGTTIGHVYPVFFGFKGGKAVACSVGLLISTNIVLFPIAALVFFGLIFWKKYVSLASIVTAIVMSALVFWPWIVSGILAINQAQNVGDAWYVDSFVNLVAYILLIFSHRSNIKRLINGNESQIKTSKK